MTMKASSMLSRAFFRRPAVRELVPDLKLVLTVLTVCCESHAGVYRPAGLSDDTGLNSDSVDGAMANLERAGHIVTDADTGEVFITAFYRDNTFKNERRAGQWANDYQQIESAKLREAVDKAIAMSPERMLLASKKVENIEKQGLALQEQVEVKVEIKKEAEAAAAKAPPAAVSMKTKPLPASPDKGGQLGSMIAILKKAGAKTSKPNPILDDRNEAEILAIAAAIGDAVVVDAITKSKARYLSEARKALVASGLKATAERKQKDAQAAEADQNIRALIEHLDAEAARKRAAEQQQAIPPDSPLGRQLGKLMQCAANAR